MYKKFSSNVSGSMALAFALLIVPLMMAVGMTIDYARAKAMKTRMQGAIDAAVLSAATEKTFTDSQRIEHAKHHFASMFAETPPPVASITISNGLINGTATYSMPTSFMAIINLNSLGVGVASQAQIASLSSPCILLLEPSQISLIINGNSQLKTGCAVHVNSSNSEALYLNSVSKIVATDICVKGGYKLNGGSTSSPTPKTGCPVKSDPLASVPEPTYGACNFTDFVVPTGQTKTLNPGVYCKKLEIQGGATVTLLPGVYVFPDAPLLINAGGRLVGDGVMLYFKDAAGYLSANSGAVVQLEAPHSGTYKGIVMFHSRSATSQLAPAHIVNSDSSSFLEGMIYAPNGKLMLNSNSTLNSTADYTAVVARAMEINSLGTFVGNANYSGSTPVSDKVNLSPSAVGVRLVK